MAQELGNVSKASRLIGYSRQQFYEIRHNYQTYGAEGLIDRLPGARGPHPSPELEKGHPVSLPGRPTQGCLRVAQELALKGGPSQRRVGPRGLEPAQPAASTSARCASSNTPRSGESN